MAMPAPKTKAEIRIRRGRVFSLLWVCFFGFLLLDIVATRLGILASSDNVLPWLFGLENDGAVIVQIGIMLLFGIFLFVATTAWIKIFFPRS